MKLELKYFIAVNAGLCLIGVVSILFGIIVGGTIALPLLVAIGTGLLAAGAVNILDRSLTLEPSPATAQRIEVIAEHRFATPKEIYDLKYEAAKVDIIGVSLTHVLEEFINDSDHKIIKRLLENNLQLRLFMVHPQSKYLEQRAIEDKQDFAELMKHQKHGVDLCVKFYEQLREAYNLAISTNTLNTNKTGCLQIKLLEFCPYITIFRIDEGDIFWGLYTSDKPGVNLPFFKTSADRDPALYRHLHQHIHGLMDRDKKYPDLVSMVELGEPILKEVIY